MNCSTRFSVFTAVMTAQTTAMLDDCAYVPIPYESGSVIELAQHVSCSVIVAMQRISTAGSNMTSRSTSQYEVDF